MSTQTADIFTSLLNNLKVGDTAATITQRRDQITKVLNRDFRTLDDSTDHQLMIGSYGRHTAIRGISDLDMIYILPPDLRGEYSGDTGPLRALNRVRDTLKTRYPTTDIRVDQCVVRVRFVSNAFTFEVQPAFANSDGSFDFPDTLRSSWRNTKPRDEIAATRECNERTSGTMRHLARMTRAWKNTHGVAMGGLLIDTLVHRFLDTSTGTPLASYDTLVRDFFAFLADEPDQSFYGALGSQQRVHVRKPFQVKAKKAYNQCVTAMDAEGTTSARTHWRTVFGTAVPRQDTPQPQEFADTEQFIEDSYPVDIRHTVTIDCTVTQAGWRTSSLRQMLARKALLFPHKELDFTITTCDAPQPYEVRWKVLNRGTEAVRRNMIRGQIITSTRPKGLHEQTKFRGNHVVECYIIHDDTVVARDTIDVPISTNNLD